MSAGRYSIGSDVWPGLSKLVEECGELQQVLGKLVGTGGGETHWDGSNLRLRLEDELADVRAAVAFFSDANDLDHETVSQRAEEKQALFEKWHREQT